MASTFVLWQKPYAKCSSTQWIDDGLIFAPFVHSRPDDRALDLERIVESGDYDRLQRLHQENGYRYNTSSEQIRRYTRMFQDLRTGDQILIPRRSFGKREDPRSAIRCQIVDDAPVFGTLHGMNGMYRRVLIIDPNAPVARVVRRSMEPYRA